MIIHDAKIEKPEVDSRGISDPVVVFTTNNLVLIAWWNANTKWWNCIESNGRDFDKETFGDVLYWHKAKFPMGWTYCEEDYS